MNIKITFLLSLLFATGAFAADGQQPPLTVAVYDFTDADRQAEQYGGKVTTLVTADLTTETNLIMVERAQLKKALGEQALDSSGMVTADTAAKVGEITGARVLVSGRVILAGHNRLVIVANIIGTESGRLFAAKVDGPADNLIDLTSELSRKIGQKIHDEYSNFVVERKSREEYLDHIAKSVTGTNRPTVLVNIHWPWEGKWPTATASTEMGVILQKAGFQVVDARSERKPDVEITGVIDTAPGPRQGQLFSGSSYVDVKVQERTTGKIILLDHQSANAVDVSSKAARDAAMVNAVDKVAERIIPLLGQ